MPHLIRAARGVYMNQEELPVRVAVYITAHDCGHYSVDFIQSGAELDSMDLATDYFMEAVSQMLFKDVDMRESSTDELLELQHINDTLGGRSNG